MELLSTGKEFREYLKHEMNLALNINFKNIGKYKGKSFFNRLYQKYGRLSQVKEKYFDRLESGNGLYTGDIELLFRILESAASKKYRKDFTAQTKNTDHL
ncbi:hypothetical protein RCL_jg4934.t1 [Rhizophagus clarus]|uniref:Uncharacterized protein n=1 Tax=Rhizophagus clarus TaxID=94130 RepID=A0A8H3LAZ1_9GLOM|nr:hypothetical protein RCL_jg4934.t1 [Rhizophagus clarus]